MGVIKFKKKPVVVEAMPFKGSNDDEIAEFVGENGYDPVDNRPTWIIKTLHGEVTVEVSDWIIKGPQGDFWPCKREIFEDSYTQDLGDMSQECYDRGYKEGHEDGYKDGFEAAYENAPPMNRCLPFRHQWLKKKGVASPALRDSARGDLWRCLKCGKVLAK